MFGAMYEGFVGHFIKSVNTDEKENRGRDGKQEEQNVRKRKKGLKMKATS